MSEYTPTTGLKYGPQTAQIEALIARVRQLTPDEVARLGAAKAAVRVTAWVTARDAAIVAAWDAASYAVRVAAWDAAWDAASYAVRVAAWDAWWVAVKDAAVALVVRDLIGRYGFTQEHYDLLTKPWRATLGPIHPDDEELPDE